MLGESSAAKSLYLDLIKVAPHNAMAHAALGLMLLGTGARNFASINACGLNYEIALPHLRFALQLDPEMKVSDISVSGISPLHFPV